MKKITFILLLPFLSKAQFSGAGAIASNKDLKFTEFISASRANITNSQQMWAVHYLVKMSKGLGTWSKDLGEYPMIGGNANAHSYNLIDVTQLRITWSGGVTHANTGVRGNGSNGEGLIAWIPTANNTHMHLWNRTNNATGLVSGRYEPAIAGTPYWGIEPNYAGETFLSAGDLANLIRVVSTNPIGFWGASRTSSTLFKGYYNNAPFATVTAANSINVTPPSFTILRRNPDGSSLASTKEINSVSLGFAYTDTDMLNKYNIYNYINTVLAR